MNLDSQASLTHKQRQSRARSLNKNTLNNSTAKRLVFFPSAPRFPLLKTEEVSLICNKASLARSQKSSSVKKRQTTLPRAQRSLFSECEKQLCRRPSPQDYRVKSQDQIFRVKCKGNTIGRASPLRGGMQKQRTPSASEYYKELGQTKRSFNRTHTFQREARNLLHFFNDKGKDSPGPVYNFEDFFKENFKREAERGKIRAKMIKMPPKKQVARREELSMINLIRLSPIKEEKGKILRPNVGFTTTIRGSERVNATIGPGSYRVFSEFSGSL